MYSDVVTVFNRYQSKSADIWIPTVLHGVDLNADRAAIITKYGADSKDNAVLHIKYIIDDTGVKLVGEKPYLTPKNWERLPNDELTGYITFNSGTNFTFFTVGEFESAEPIPDEDYTEGFYGYMNTNCDGVYAVTSAAEYSVIPHFEILAK